MIGLQSARGRLLVFTLLSIAIFFVPYDWLTHLSIWQALDIPSPSIGLTRAYHLLLHGDIDGAWQRNGLIFIILIVGVIILIKDIQALSRHYSASK